VDTPAQQGKKQAHGHRAIKWVPQRLSSSAAVLQRMCLSGTQHNVLRMPIS